MSVTSKRGVLATASRRAKKPHTPARRCKSFSYNSMKTISSATLGTGWLGALEQRTGLREIIPQLVHRICRISKGSELSAHHGLRQAEGVATEQIDMAPP